MTNGNSSNEPRSEAERLARCGLRVHGMLATVDALEEYFETHERELVDEILKTVVGRIDTIRERSKP